MSHGEERLLSTCVDPDLDAEMAPRALPPPFAAKCAGHSSAK